jgi:hypothetical protein
MSRKAPQSLSNGKGQTVKLLGLGSEAAKAAKNDKTLKGLAAIMV